MRLKLFQTMRPIHAAPSGEAAPIDWALTIKAANLAKPWLDKWRRLSLAARFAIVACAIIGLGMAVLGTWVSHRVKDGVVKHAAVESAFYMKNFIEPYAQDLATGPKIGKDSADRLDALVRASSLGTHVLVMKVWAPGGLVAYSSEKNEIGQTFPVTPRLKSAWTGNIESQLEGLDDDEHEHERPFNVPLMEIYAPIHATGTDRIIGVAEFYEKADELLLHTGRLQKQTWLIVGGLAVLMMLCLSTIVREGSKTIIMQEEKLKSQIVDLSNLLSTNQELQSRLAAAHGRLAKHSELFLRRVGSELHDGPAQLIGFALLRLDSIAGRKPGQETAAAQTVESIRNALQEAIKEIRQISSGLNLPNLEEGTLKDAVEMAVVSHERRTNTIVDVRWSGNMPADCSQAIKTCLYRCTQEALNNAFKHAAGQGQTVHLEHCDSHIKLEISDAGPGFELKPALLKQDSLGLNGMRDRIESLNGRFEVASLPGSGTKLTAYFSTAALETMNGV